MIQRWRHISRHRRRGPHMNLKFASFAAGIALAALMAPQFAIAQDSDDEPSAQVIPNTGQYITPTAPRGSRFEPLNPNLRNYPEYLAGQAVTTVVSPDKKTLLILTSGYNQLNYTSGMDIGKTDPTGTNEYVFVYDISNKVPVKKQVVQIANTYNGIVFDPSGTTFYVAGGVDDNLHIYDLTAGQWAERTAGSPIVLGHKAGNGFVVSPTAAGVAITADAKTLVVTDYYNDSISILTNTGGTWAKTSELDLRPGKLDPVNASGVPGGEYPFWVVLKGTTAYISSIRDREIDVVNVAGTPSILARIKVKGQPNKMTLTADGSKLYVAEDQTDTVDIIDTAMNTVMGTIAAGAPSGLLPGTGVKYTGYNTDSLTLSPDEKTLYVSHGNTNDIAVVSLVSGNGTPYVAGLIPTGWYPTSVSLSADGSYMYVVNFKSVTGPNPGNCHGLTAAQSAACAGTNQYNLQLIKAGFQSFPTPTLNQLDRLTQVVADNNHYARATTQEAKAKMAFLRSKIQHVIFIIKENRTYDQILGDLPTGNGDPDLAEFGGSTTPNFHKIASSFVDLDNFYDRSEVSMDGWPWTVSARAPDVVERQTSVNYAGRGLSNDSEGTNRNVNIAYPTLAARLQANPLSPNDPDVLPGTVDTAAPDGPNFKPNAGYIWNAALRAGLSLRNYGFFIDLARYQTLPAPYTALQLPLLEMPFTTKTQVAYSTNAALRPHTDPYFRGFDNAFPDYWRFREWEREFDTNYASAGLPNLELVRFMHDHTGNFSTAIDGVNTAELQEADNDYAVGLLIDKISKSVYKNNTLIFVIEDDSQDGPDHVDSHRSTTYIAGPYVKQGKIISTSYNTVDFLRTIEDILGLTPLNLNDSVAVPMADVFTEKLKDWTYTAVPSPLLANTTLPIDKTLFAGMKSAKPTHEAEYWASVTKGMDFSAEDRIDFGQYNRILWKGLMGDKPYPAEPSGLDLRENRTALLASHQSGEATAAASGGSF